MILITFDIDDYSMVFIKKHLPIAIILIFHIVGLVGFWINPSYFQSLTPVNLSLSLVLVLLMSNQSNWKFYAVFFATGLFGFFIEVLGVKTELIFGSYHYGNSFGYKLFSVPLLIGVNWAMLLYSTSQWVSFKSNWLNVLSGSALMVFLDFFMEQSCSRFDFWYWKNAQIPYQNYIAWFFISLILNYFFQKTLQVKNNITAKAFYVIELLFFMLLYLLK